MLRGQIWQHEKSRSRLLRSLGPVKVGVRGPCVAGEWGRPDYQTAGRTEIRHLAKELDFRPRKSFGQNFVHDANTVRRVVSASGINRHDHVLEVGPGLGSLTLALLDRGARVTAVEIDPVLAGSCRTPSPSTRTARSTG